MLRGRPSTANAWQSQTWHWSIAFGSAVDSASGSVSGFRLFDRGMVGDSFTTEDAKED